MIDLKKGYDSETDNVLCDWCKGPFGSQDKRIIYGTGNSLLLVFHSGCEVYHRYQPIVAVNRTEGVRNYATDSDS